MSFEFKLKTESVNKLSEDVKRIFKKVIANEQMMNEIGTAIVTDVKETTQKGKSIPNGLKDFALLKESWILQKTRYAKSNPTDAAYDEGFSNLTFTGQLLNSIRHKIISKGTLLISFFDIHKGYTSSTGHKTKDIPNEKLAQYVAEAGRPFFGVRPTIRLRINRIVKKYMNRALKVQKLLKDIDN